MDEERKVCKVLGGKPEGNRKLARSERRWKDGIRMDYMKIGWGCGLVSGGSGYRQLAGSCKHGDEPMGSDATYSVT
jgi:hypothetical protein